MAVLNLKRIMLMGFVSMVLVTLTACDNRRLTGTSYTPGEVREAQTLQRGVVVDIAEVSIEPEKTGVGGVIGGVIGGIATGDTGGHGAKQIIQVVAITLGGLIGEYVERQALTRDGIEIVIDIEDGTTLSVVQEADAENPFQVGDNIRLLKNGRTLRVVKVGFPIE